MTKQKNTLKEVMRFVLPLALGGILLAFGLQLKEYGKMI